ncbi:unnamed protein product [Peniophora sp. CBMAI 1063]|nr:unnamed protein product [Peniophora sp. CBMAI 1063]
MSSPISPVESNSKRAKLEHDVNEGRIPVKIEEDEMVIDVDAYDVEPEEDHCTICLQAFVDRTVIPICSHEFCFECLMVWTGQSRKCPLCAQSIGEYVIHHIRSNNDYSKHYLPALPTSPRPQAQANRSGVRRARIPRRDRVWGRRGAASADLEEADALAQAVARRRWVYTHNLYAKHVASNMHTRYRPYPTPSQFSASPDMISKATIFLRRELQVWPNLDVEFLVTFVLSLMKSIDIRAESAVKLIAEFLDMDKPYSPGGRYVNAEHFTHEIYSFMRSPFKELARYDESVQYDIPEGLPGPSAHEVGRRWGLDEHDEHLPSPIEAHSPPPVLATQRSGRRSPSRNRSPDESPRDLWREDSVPPRRASAPPSPPLRQAHRPYKNDGRRDKGKGKEHVRTSPNARVHSRSEQKRTSRTLPPNARPTAQIPVESPRTPYTPSSRLHTLSPSRTYEPSSPRTSDTPALRSATAEVDLIDFRGSPRSLPARGTQSVPSRPVLTLSIKGAAERLQRSSREQTQVSSAHSHLGNAAGTTSSVTAAEAPNTELASELDDPPTLLARLSDVPYEPPKDAANVELGAATRGHDVLGAAQSAPAEGAAHGGRLPLDAARGSGSASRTNEARRMLLLEKLEAERRANGGSARALRAVTMPAPQEAEISPGASTPAPLPALTFTQGSTPSYPGPASDNNAQVAVEDDPTRAEARARMRVRLAAERMRAEANAREEMLRAALRSRV